MQKQKYFSKILNFVMLSGLIYLSLRLIGCINTEEEMIENLIREKMPTNEKTKNNIFNWVVEIKNKLPLRKKNIINNGLLLLNGSFAVLLAGFINWTNILFTGTI